MDHRAVARAAAAEIVTLNAARNPCPLETPTTSTRSPGSKAETVTLSPTCASLEFGSKFADEARRLDALLLEVSGERAGQAGSLDRLKTQSDGIVAVLLFRSALHDRTGTSRDHRHGHGAPVGGEDAGHPDFTAQDILHHFSISGVGVR